ncbi:superoxide dismutase [Lineolata rhizophorae]|uniref:superoxide dismutase n=1 Tax=Lineolata rhizophorae TaxID=578093 RepID=A0A6A6PAU6_9PEZI|nr:superoxide dismutase [Lineolata rhizophorae]
MRAAATIFALLGAVGYAVADDAPVVTDNPTGAIYNVAFEGNVNGIVVAKTHADGTGVDFSLALTGLPADQGPFGYHIHQMPVPADGNCTATGGHLNPYDAEGDCVSDTPAACEVGDLSGKHGKLSGNSTAFAATYVDEYTSLVPDDVAYIGSRSIVIHLADGSRYACANFVNASPSGVLSSISSSNSASPTAALNSTLTSMALTGTGAATHTASLGLSATSSPATSPSASASTTPEPVGDNPASKTMVSAGAVLAALGAFLL